MPWWGLRRLHRAGGHGAESGGKTGFQAGEGVKAEGRRRVSVPLGARFA